MPTNKIPELLATLTSQLRATHSGQQEMLAELQETLAKALLTQDPQEISGQEFLFEKSDLLMSADLGAELEKAERLVERARNLQQAADEELRVFVRTLPVRTTQLTGSVSPEAAGARVTTLGPFINAVTGRPIFVDVVKVRKLTPLYVQGQAEPVILFNAEFSTSLLTRLGSPAPEITRKFKVVPDTVWILARLFDAAAPAGYYAGLRVKGGSIALSADPVLTNGKLTIAASTSATCDLNLEQNTAFDSDPASPFGIDARNASFQLPENFQFVLKGAGKTITAISPSSWKLYGSENRFAWANDQVCVYNPVLSRLAIPLQCQNRDFGILDCQSPFCTVSGKTVIAQSWWGLPVAKIDVNAPTEADGNGALIALCADGLAARWQKLRGQNLSLRQPFILGEPGRIGITDLTANAAGATQSFTLWQDEANPHGSALELAFGTATLFLFNTTAQGEELLAGFCNADVQSDRPVQVDGHAVPIRSRQSLFTLAVGKHRKLFVLLDENMLWDNKLPADKIPKVRPIALAMHNALFTVTPPNGLVIFADVNEDYTALSAGRMFLYFGLFSYLPTLPDPYAADLGVLESQFQRTGRVPGADGNPNRNPQRDSMVLAWLIGLVQWQQLPGANDKVGVSFHFAPLQEPLKIMKDRQPETDTPVPVNITVAPFLPAFRATEVGDRASDAGLIQVTPRTMADFALLDVSSKANQMGVAFAFGNRGLRQIVERYYQVDIQDDTAAQVFPVQMSGLDVVTPGRNAQAFTVPQISWEPVLNTAPPEASGSAPFDPPIGWNYYQSDGSATRVGNLSSKPVTLSPIPMAKYLVQCYENREDGRTYAMFNLPFGMLALSFLDSGRPANQRAGIDNIMPVFDGYVIGGMQLELTGGVSVNPGDGRLFEGFTFQLHNINDVAGSGATQYSTLAHSPDIIFNGEFSASLGLPGRPAVPLEKIGLSGYGASTFSNWENKDALFAQTSQAFFNVAVGRTSREVVQVKSLVYPWGIRVVRTITLFRMGNGYVARVDSGWQAQSDGLFDFRYPVNDHTTTPATKIAQLHPNPFKLHPGPVRGLRNVRNIHEIPKLYTTDTQVVYLWKKGPGGAPVADEPPKSLLAILQGITFDCEVEIDNVVEGGQGKLVPSKGVTGYVQLAPPAAPIDAQAFQGLMGFEGGSIGGPINCVIRIAGTEQRMRLDRFDVNASQDQGGGPVFAGAVRGAVVLPKDGSWTLVQHTRGSGEVTPLPDKLSVPLIAEGELNPDSNAFPPIANVLQRIAYPGDLLKNPDPATINFGFLQNMNTQKVLFLTPSFKSGVGSLMSKTPPLLADAYRLMNTSSIFPNIADAESAFGTAIQLLNGVDGAGNPVQAFFKNGLTDNLGKELYELLELKAKEEAGKLLDQGYKLLKAKGNAALDQALKFDLPSFEYPLVHLEDVLKIYIEYKAKSNSPKDAPPTDYVGKLDFDVDSFAGDLADTWKGRMNNLAMVVDLGPLTRLMTIKGNFNSQKGREADYGGDASGKNLPLPEIEFSDAVDAVIKILEILSALSTGEYGDALKKGLKIAMSNSANLWEYKFEATKEIALVRFPPERNLYEAPTTPLKLEASMSLGVFFNAALKVTSNPKQLLPTAGAFFKFHGGLQVMCVSLAAATVYAVGSADLELRADTSPLIALTMKFGFGAQITVGLPVIANVSVLFMVGVEVYVDSSKKVIVTAFLLFRGHAEILGGIVAVTITIEARGSIEKAGDNLPCNCKAQVTFGLDISIFLIINLSFEESWEETRQIA